VIILIKYTKLIMKHLWILIRTFLMLHYKTIKASELVYYTRIRIHALEKAQINEQAIAMILQLVEIFPYANRCIKEDLFSSKEAQWTRQILFGKEDATVNEFNDEHQSTFNDILRSRRSIRRYKDRQVEDDKIKSMIDNVIWSPSACNRQPWRFIVIRDSKILNLFARYIQQFIGRAPSAILMIQSKDAYNSIDIKYTPYLDAGIAAQNIMLTAHSLGLGSCFVNVGDYELSSQERREIRKALKIEEDWILTALITIGYTAFNPKAPGRKDYLSVIMNEKFEIQKNYDGKKAIVTSSRKYRIENQ
jgi:nitroreductase